LLAFAFSELARWLSKRPTRRPDLSRKKRREAHERQG